MSEKALVDTIYVEMDVQKSKGNENLLVFFGNYGQVLQRMCSIYLLVRLLLAVIL